MLCEVCYCALSSIFVVRLTRSRPAGRGARPGPAPFSPALTEIKVYFQIGLHSPLDWLSGGPPARWFVIFHSRVKRVYTVTSKESCVPVLHTSAHCSPRLRRSCARSLSSASLAPGGSLAVGAASSPCCTLPRACGL